MTLDIKEALYVAETARRNGPEAVSREQLCEALLVIVEDREQLTEELREYQAEQWDEVG